MLFFRYNFKKVAQYKQLTLEEAEEKMNNRKKTADGYQRWMMKAANNGAFGEHGKLDDKESKRSRQKTGDDDEGPSSDNGEEDEDEEVDRKSRHGLNKKSGYDDDDDEGTRGGDLDDDDYDVEKGEYLALFVLYYFYESMLKVINLLLVSFM
jgi:transcription initiation factor TFIIF subunit alpha